MHTFINKINSYFEREPELIDRMKKRGLSLLLATLLGSSAIAQNLLPYDWELTAENGKKDSVNFLVSWEHQGHFWHDGNCSVTTNFQISQPEIDYTLTVSMTCFIKSIRINETVIGENIANKFRTDRDAFSTFDIPKHSLKKGENQIEILCNDLGYTGGFSNNFCSLTPKGSTKQEFVNIEIEPDNHLFINRSPQITLNYKVEKDARMTVRIESDFHKILLDSIFCVSSTNHTIAFDLSEAIVDAGFYQCTAMILGDGYSGDVQWIGVRPEAIKCENGKCEGFDAHWATAKAELQTIAPNFRMHKKDSLCSDSRDCYVVEMQSLDNLTVRGYYFVPRKGKKHVAILHVPGYGYGYENLSEFTKANVDYAEFAICVRGHGISADVFNPGFGIPGVWGYKLYDRDSMAYRGIFMDCVRAVEFLHSRYEIDSNKIAVMGGSQGGGLTLATAALCPEMISACAYFDPFPCDIRHQILTREMCRTEISLYLQYYNNPISFEEAMNLQEFIDTRSFAESIQCPTFFATALFDDDCPPHGGFTAYNHIHSPKSYIVFPHDSHLSESNYSKYFIKWILDTFNTK